VSYLENGALEKVLALRPAQFNWIGSTTTRAGFVAQDALSVIPEAVPDTNTDGFLQWDSNAVISYSVKAIQELNVKLEDLATTTPEISEGSFTTRFFSSLLTRIRTWLADAQNGITDFFARRGHFEELCVDDVCVTRDQFAEVFGNQSAQAGSAAAGAPEFGGPCCSAGSTRIHGRNRRGHRTI
jgi:hypothetical protein